MNQPAYFEQQPVERQEAALLAAEREWAGRQVASCPMVGCVVTYQLEAEWAFNRLVFFLSWQFWEVRVWGMADTASQVGCWAWSCLTLICMSWRDGSVGSRLVGPVSAVLDVVES